LSTLTEQPVPNLLGSNTRTPGFDPYLNFVLHNIFLKCLSRGYKKQNEKVKNSLFVFLNIFELIYYFIVGNQWFMSGTSIKVFEPI